VRSKLTYDSIEQKMIVWICISFSFYFSLKRIVYFFKETIPVHKRMKKPVPEPSVHYWILWIHSICIYLICISIWMFVCMCSEIILFFLKQERQFRVPEKRGVQVIYFSSSDIVNFECFDVTRFQYLFDTHFWVSSWVRDSLSFIEITCQQKK
jgi:hypothetical protein